MTIQALLITSVLLPLVGGFLLRTRPQLGRLAAFFSGGSVLAVWGARTLTRLQGEEVTLWWGVDGLSGVVALAGAALCLVLWAPGRSRPAATATPGAILFLQGALLAVLVLRDLLWVCAAVAMLVGLALRPTAAPAVRRARGAWLVGILALFTAATAVRSATGQQAVLSSLPVGHRAAFNRLVETERLVPDARGSWGYPGLGGWSAVTSELTTLEAVGGLGLFEHPQQQAGNLALRPLVLTLGWLAAFALVAALVWARWAPGSVGLGGAEVLAPAAAAYLALRLAGLFSQTSPRWPAAALLLLGAGLLAGVGWRGPQPARPLGWAGACVAIAAAAALLLGPERGGLLLAVGLVAGAGIAQWQAGQGRPAAATG